MRWWLCWVLACFAAQAFAGQSFASERRVGTVVLASTAFELSAPLAQELAAERPHALLHVGALPAIDPLIRSGTELVALQLVPETFGVSQERAAMDLLRRTQAVVLSGGTWVDWWRLTHDSTKDNALARALVQAQRQGRTIVAIGGAAEYCAQQARLSHLQIQRALRNPRRADSFLAWGLALVPELALEVQRENANPQHFFEAAHAALATRAAYLGQDLALVIRGSGLRWEVEGPGRGLLLELEAAHRAWAVPLAAPLSARWDATRNWQAFASIGIQHTEEVWLALWNSPAGKQAYWKTPTMECLQAWNAQEKAWQLRLGKRP